MKKRSPFTLAAAALVFLVQFASSEVAASGMGVATFGGELGSVVAPNPTAIYYNPGALGFSGTQLMVDGTLVFRSTSWSHHQSQGDVAEPPGFEGANYGTARSLLVGGGPPFGASLQLGKHLVLGGGVHVPWGGGSFRFDRNERFANSMYPGAADGIARWHAYEVGMAFFYGTGGAALRFGPLSIGATFNLIWSSLSINRAQTPSGNNDLTREQRVSGDFSELLASFGVGAMWEVLPDKLWVGASYQAQPGLGKLTLEGTYTLDATVDIMDQTRVDEATMHLAMPDIVRAGVRFKISPSLEIRFSGSFTRWSVNQTMCIGRRNQPCTVLSDGGEAPGSGVIRVQRKNWNDTIGVQGGVSYWLNPSLELFAGTAYEPAAMPDATLDPVSFDANNYSIGAGARLRVFETWFVSPSYNHQQFLPRDITGKSDLANPAVKLASRGLDGGGKYESWIGTIHLNVAKTF